MSATSERKKYRSPTNRFEVDSHSAWTKSAKTIPENIVDVPLVDFSVFTIDLEPIVG